ncbi:hypothetical protein ACFX2B_024859 [Malus domestica]
MDGSSSQSSTPMVSVLGKRKQTQPSGTLQLGTPSPQEYLHNDYYEDYWDDDPDMEEEEEEEGEEGEEEVEEVEEVVRQWDGPPRKKGNRRKGPSPAWNDAKRVTITDNNGEKLFMAECKHCKLLVPAHPRTHGTAGILKHLRKWSGSSLFENVDPNQPTLTQARMGGPVVTHTFNQKRLDRRCVRWIIIAEMPFRVVDQEDFRAFIRDLNPKYKLPNRHKVAAAVLELYFEEKAKIKSVIEGLRVSITTDTWTSIQMINYMVITAHFLDANWGLHKRILNFVQVTSHKGDDIGRCLEICLNDWGIDKVFSITVDNASANDTAIAYMKRRLKSNGTLLLDGAHLHMRCACHILNLIVKDGMTELSREIDAIRNCVKFIHSSPARLESFREYCVLLRFDRMSSIPFDVVTRWNATYQMLNSTFKFKEVFSKMTFECDSFIAYFKEEVSKEVNGVTTKAKRVGPPEVDDWERSVSFAHFLKKIYDATLTLSATLTPTSHLILSTVIALQVEIEEQILNASNATLQSVATSMKLMFDKYWGDFEKVNPILFVAQSLDPRYKFDMLETNLEELGYDCDKIREEKVRVKGYVTELYNAYKEGGILSGSSGSSTSSSATSNMEQRSSVVLDDGAGGVMVDIDVASRITKKIQRKRAEAQQNEIANEVDMYFNDPHQSLTYEGFNLLDWWKGNCGQYPILSKVAKDVLALPSSTVASENAFSLGGRVVDPFRASLTPKTVEALVCTSDWLRGKEFCFYKEPTLDELYFYEELERLEKSMANLGGEEYTTQENEMPPPPPPLRPPQVEVQRQNQINQSLPPRPPIFRGRAQPSTSRGRVQVPTRRGQPQASTRSKGRRGRRGQQSS